MEKAYLIFANLILILYYWMVYMKAMDNKKLLNEVDAFILSLSLRSEERIFPLRKINLDHLIKEF
ncbi:hypothetical protein DU80_03535 [Methanosarcina mazei]|uniref:Uncharacterized protein n=1 Tax=Methanosarcina mazei TaxID=2209 RepID=A0A0F8JRL4_METMZ|nr:hypothetical protein DU47_02450 [Methanosarcina mazei]KKG03339.1 hypothetical protein DU31_12570 [Methanosarcina mazei]KKG04770.1 hypothetical protein DU40_20195 [Methanosarcina mazei]KKG36581.1 hypothetical protein DU30_14935 [Methanosarcina mazei]KKG50031.1 hypothetical protein DU33_18520 [Methanosarcina mazei]